MNPQKFQNSSHCFSPVRDHSMPEPALSPYQHWKGISSWILSICMAMKPFSMLWPTLNFLVFYIFGYLMIPSFLISASNMYDFSATVLPPLASASFRGMSGMQNVFLRKVFMHFCPRFISSSCSSALTHPMQCFSLHYPPRPWMPPSLTCVPHIPLLFAMALFPWPHPQVTICLWSSWLGMDLNLFDSDCLPSLDFCG